MLKTALLAATLVLASAGAVQLLPAGEFAAIDGRPGKGKHWKLSDEQGIALAARINAAAAVTPLVIDYEHQTLRSAANGQAAPAAGWIKSVEWLTGRGLFSQVEWCAAARERIAAGEYRYISPVIEFDRDTGEVLGLRMAALTNVPALQGMEPVVAALNALTPPDPTHPKESHVTLLAALCAALALPAATTEESALTALAALKADRDALKARPDKLNTALATALGLKDGATETEALSAVQALKAADGSTTQVIATLTAQVTDLAARLAEFGAGELASLVDDAITEGKFAPAQRDGLLNWGRKDLAALKAHVAISPVIPGLKGQAKPGADPGATQTVALSATQKLIAEQLGIPEADYAKQLATAQKAAA